MTMELIDKFKALGLKSKKMADNLTNEEITKTALIMPFIQLLGYDIFDPQEVVPEFQAQAGVKKDQRVDYALCKDGNPIVLIEAKAYGASLDKDQLDQLKRYFPFVKTARVGILTDGNRYRFFTDLEVDNVMDDSPYFEVSLDNINDDDLDKILLLAKDKYNDESTIKIAEQLKFTKQFKLILSKQYEQPEEDFVRFFAKKVWNGQINQNVKDKLTPLLKESFRQWTEEKINARLRKAIEGEEKQQQEEVAEATPEPANNNPEANDSDKLGLNIIKAILADVCDVSRIYLRPSKTYCAVLLDDNNRKTLVRFYFQNPEKLKIDLYGFMRVEPPFQISTVEDIYNYKEKIIEIFQRIEAGDTGLNQQSENKQ
jgi:hypothetical protein